MADEAYYREKAEQEKEWKDKGPAFRAEIENHPFLAPYKEKYRQMGYDNLVDYIVNKKISVGTMGQRLEKRYEADMLQHVEYCDVLLELLLQKKLFNLQLQWRAGQIQLEGIEISDDFYAYASDIFNCPFIEPITPPELEVLKLYMKTNNFSTDVGMFGVSDEWQDYDNIMKKDEEGDLSGMPDFFEFYDGQMGTFYLLNLPDVRSPEEEKYIQFWREAQAQKLKENADQSATENPPAAKKYFPFFDNELEKKIFAVTENEDFWPLRSAQKKLNREYLENSDEDELIRELDEIKDEEINLPGYLTWNEGLERALEIYKLRKAAEVLDLAYEKYLMKAELRLFDETKIQQKKEGSLIRGAILEGRKLAGEAGDLEV